MSDRTEPTPREAALWDYLAKRDALSRPCPRCGAIRFEIVGFLQQPIYSHPRDQQSAGTFRTVVLACEHCQYVVQHGERTDDPFPY